MRATRLLLLPTLILSMARTSSLNPVAPSPLPSVVTTTVLAEAMLRAVVDVEALTVTAMDRVTPAATSLARTVAAEVLLAAEAVPRPVLLKCWRL